jgi:hypothetical protein
MSIPDVISIAPNESSPFKTIMFFKILILLSLEKTLIAFIQYFLEIVPRLAIAKSEIIRTHARSSQNRIFCRGRAISHPMFHDELPLFSTIHHN